MALTGDCQEEQDYLIETTVIDSSNSATTTLEETITIETSNIDMALTGDCQEEQDYLIETTVIDSSNSATTTLEETITIETSNIGLERDGDEYKSQGTHETCVSSEEMACEDQPQQDVNDSLLDTGFEIDGDEYESEETFVITEEMASENQPEQDVMDPLNIGEFQFKWTHETTLLMLEEYYKLKDEFRDPTIKNSIPWSKIKSVFYNHGHIITKDCLSTKFRNLKKTFSNICELKSKKARKGKITWIYYKHFQKIFKNDPTFNKGSNKKPELMKYQAVPAISNIVFTPSVPFTLFRVTPANESVIPTPVISSNIITKLDDNSLTSSSTKITIKNRKRAALIQEKQVQEARKQEVVIDKKRSIEIKKLIYAIKQNNTIQRERNCLLKELLNLI